MPIYEYECPTCEKVKEVIQSAKSPPPKCPEDAQHGEMARKISVSSFQLKGMGWAKSGYSG